MEIEKRHKLKWRMQLAIAHNPYTKDPGVLMNFLEDKTRADLSHFDEPGFDRLASKLARNPRIIVK